MIDRDRVLRPLDEARPAIEQLQEYESPAALRDALRATWHAVDSALRTLLRGAGQVPDELRLAALSRDAVSLDAVLTGLRRQDLISLHVAGRVHELGRAVARAEESEVRAADADLALETVSALRSEIMRRDVAPERTAFEPLRRGAEPSLDAGPEDMEAVGGDDVVLTTSGGERRPLRRPIILAAAAILLVAAAAALVVLFGRSDDMDEGVAAFRAGRAGVAEQHFRAALQRDAENVTARLYLARILREQGRHEEAAGLLREAARLSPRDAAVRRELGYLFLTLNRAEQAAAQFQQSVELEPGEPLGWVGLVQALRLAGNASAADLALGRAPAAAQAMIRTGRE